MGNKNVLVPFELLVQTAKLLGHCDTASCGPSIQQSHDDAMRAIINKLQAVVLRRAYSEIIFAKDDSSRAAAREKYVGLKREFHK